MKRRMALALLLGLTVWAAYLKYPGETAATSEPYQDLAFYGAQPDEYLMGETASYKVSWGNYYVRNTQPQMNAFPQIHWHITLEYETAPGVWVEKDAQDKGNSDASLDGYTGIFTLPYVEGMYQVDARIVATLYYKTSLGGQSGGISPSPLWFTVYWSPPPE